MSEEKIVIVDPYASNDGLVPGRPLTDYSAACG
jgi:hypothetical protein